MRSLALFVFVGALQAQTCTHQTTYNPDGGSVLVYRNGLLLKEGIDYTYTRPVVSLKWWSATDQFTYVYDRMVSIQVPGVLPAAFMNEYRLNREDAVCNGNSVPQPGVPVTRLTGLQILLGQGLLGTSAGITYDSAVLLSRSTFQAGLDVVCRPAGGNPLVYTCTDVANGGVNLTVYTPYSIWVFVPDVPNGASPAVDLGLGPLTLKKLNNGALVDLAAGDMPATGEGYLLMLDPGVGRALVVGSIGGAVPVARKVCTGSGTTGSPPVVWNCTGMEYYAFTAPNGSIVDYIAVAATPEVRMSVAMGPPLWTSAPLP
jgi:hypothetical protein